MAQNIPGPNEVVPPARRGKMIIYLRDYCGLTAQEAAQAVGGNPHDTAAQVGRNIAAYAKANSNANNGAHGKSGK